MTTERVDGFEGLGSIYLDIDQRFSNLDYSGELSYFHEWLAHEHARYFSSETAPSGEYWAPLAESTVKAKGHDTILFDTGDLERSLTAIGSKGNISEVAERGSIFGTSDDKSVFHQFGTSKMPRREHVGTNEEGVDFLADLIGDFVVESLKFKVGGP